MISCEKIWHSCDAGVIQGSVNVTPNSKVIVQWDGNVKFCEDCGERLPKWMIFKVSDV